MISQGQSRKSFTPKTLISPSAVGLNPSIPSGIRCRQKNVTFDEIYDLLAVRIVIKTKEGISEKRQCFDILSLITDIYTPKPDRIRDWITIPKANGYEALHVTVMGPKGQWVEVQIRTERMDEIAERGFCRALPYKGEGSTENEPRQMAE